MSDFDLNNNSELLLIAHCLICTVLVQEKAGTAEQKGGETREEEGGKEHRLVSKPP